MKEKILKRIFTLQALLLIFLSAAAKVSTYVGSTPAHEVTRIFLQISLTDSIDFIRWKLEIDSGTFKLEYRYGLAKPGTPGFSNEQGETIDGKLIKTKNHYLLKRNDKQISLLRINENILHFIDRNNRLLIGNGGYSYALNNMYPVNTDAFKSGSVKMAINSPLVFEGRTPCRKLSSLLGLNKSEACNKMKWYIILYTDPVTRKASYFLMGGMKYRKETMTRGTWDIVTSNGRIIYRLKCDKWIRSLNLLKADNNILLFIDGNGQPLVGNGDFSYTLNRRSQEYPRK